jgi:hypothetical protein
MDRQRKHTEVAARLRGEAAVSRWTGIAIRRDPIAIAGFGTDKAPAGTLGIVPLIVPDALDEYAHGFLLSFGAPLRESPAE